jgi:hypothetical protein
MNPSTLHLVLRLLSCAPGRFAVFLLAFLFVSLNPLRAAAPGSTSAIHGTVGNAATGNNLNLASVQVNGMQQEFLTAAHAVRDRDAFSRRRSRG